VHLEKPLLKQNQTDSGLKSGGQSGIMPVDKRFSTVD